MEGQENGKHGKKADENPVKSSNTELSGACPTDEHDPELDDLLDESLADLTTYSSLQPGKPGGGTSTENATPGGAASGAKHDEDIMQALFGGAAGAEDAGELQEHLKTLLQDDPLVMAEFAKLTQSTTSSDASGAQPPADFADTLAETLTSLSANAESLQTEMSDDELMKSFQESLNLGAEGNGGSSDFMPMMQNMMSNLLSKDILYPSLKDLADKYPDWLSANNGKLPKKQLDSYAKQFDIVSKLCDLYEAERETDTQKIKDERLEKILDLMTEMQDCGPPPKEIVGELAPGLNFDAEGNPQLPGMEQCSVM